jgi:hypothetical protein
VKEDTVFIFLGTESIDLDLASELYCVSLSFNSESNVVVFRKEF